MSEESENKGNISGKSVSRRKFLTIFGAAAAGVALAGCGSEAAPSPTQAPAAAATKAPAAAAPTAALAVAATAAPTAAAAKPANFPAGKPIQIFIGGGAGGGMDVACRTLQPYLEKVLDTRILPVNKPAAGGQSSMSEARQQKPDGYTLVMVSPPSWNSMWLDPRREPDFKRKDFFYLANQVRDPGVIVVKPDAPWKTVNDLAKEAKDKPGSLIVTMSLPGGDDEYFIRDVMSKTGADFRIVTNDGAAPAISQFMGGHAQVLACNESEAVPLVKQGEARIIGMGHPQRTKYNPDVPTLIEQGLDVISYSMRGYGADARIPKPILDYLAWAFQEAMKDKEFQAKMESLSYPVAYLGPKEYTEAIVKEDEKVSRLSKEFKLFEPIAQD